MGGLIRRREVLYNTYTVIRAFGFRVYFRCLLAPRGSTFLSIVHACGRI